MTYWAQLLHFYQPPPQTHEILHKVAEESYRPLIEVIRQHPNARLAVNIQGVLTELLLEHGLGDVVLGLKELAEKGQVEFVEAAGLLPTGDVLQRGNHTGDPRGGARMGDPERGGMPGGMADQRGLPDAIELNHHRCAVPRRRAKQPGVFSRDRPRAVCR